MVKDYIQSKIVIYSFSTEYIKLIRLKTVKPWSSFRINLMVCTLRVQNSFEKASFLLFRFLWTSKENEMMINKCLYFR